MNMMDKRVHVKGGVGRKSETPDFLNSLYETLTNDT
jgi:hypothetical protein